MKNKSITSGSIKIKKISNFLKNKNNLTEAWSTISTQDTENNVEQDFNDELAECKFKDPEVYKVFKEMLGHPITIKEAKAIKEFNYNCFQSDKELTSFNEFAEYFTNVETIGYAAFEWCENLKSITIPDSVKKIGNHTFACCVSLISIIIPNSVTYIGEDAFFNCDKLKNILIPKSVEMINNEAFFGCINLENIKILNTSIRLGDDVFDDWLDNLKAIEYNGKKYKSYKRFINAWKKSAFNITNEAWNTMNTEDTEDDVEQEINENLPCEFKDPEVYKVFKEMLGHPITIKEAKAMTKFSNKWFKDNDKITSFNEFGKYFTNVEIIEDYAFRCCDKLRKIKLPEKLGYIGAECFINCQHLKFINIPETLECVGYLPFYNVPKELYNSTTYFHCPEIVSGNVKIPENIKTINLYAFNYCQARVIEIPVSVTRIERGAFSEADKIFAIIWKNHSYGSKEEFIKAWKNQKMNEAWSTISTQDTQDNVEQELNDYLSYTFKDIQDIIWDGKLDDFADYIENKDKTTTCYNLDDNSLSFDFGTNNIFNSYLQNNNSFDLTFDYEKGTLFYSFYAETDELQQHLENFIFENNYGFNDPNNFPLIYIDKDFNLSFKETSWYIDGKINEYKLNDLWKFIETFAVHYQNSLSFFITNKDWIEKVNYLSDFIYLISKKKSLMYKNKYIKSLSDLMNYVDEMDDPNLYPGCESAFPFENEDEFVLEFKNYTTKKVLSNIKKYHKEFLKIAKNLKTPYLKFENKKIIYLNNNIQINEAWSAMETEDNDEDIEQDFNDELRICKFKDPEIYKIFENQLGHPITVSEAKAMTKFDFDFYGYDKITSFDEFAEYFTNIKRIEKFTFQYYEKLTSITIPNSVTSIGEYAFAGCKNLKSITIPDSVTKIEKGAFSYCKSLTSITIPDSVTSIEDFTFQNCTNLKSINIPNSVTNIGEWAFQKCYNLLLIIIPNSVKVIKSNTFHNCENLIAIKIPDSVTTIENGAFNNCKNLIAIKIPDSVTSIGSDAFYNCKNLKSVTISGSVTSIEEYTFSYCTNLKSINIPASVTSIGEYAFAYCANLKSVTISGSVTNIENNTFEDCINLTSITIPDSVTRIKFGAFNNCHNLTSIKWQNNIYNSVEEFLNAFSVDCEYLDVFNSNSTNESWSTISTEDTEDDIEQDFNENFPCSFKDKEVYEIFKKELGHPITVKEAKEITIFNFEKFQDNNKIKSFDDFAEFFPQVKTIEKQVFMNCYNLTSINLPNSLKILKDEVFSGCSKLESVNLGKSLTEMGNDTFAYCEKLHNINIPETLTKIDSNTFLNVPIALYNSTTYFHCPSDDIFFRIPKGITKIANGAFYYCTKEPKIIKIPNSITEICAGAFIGCNSIEELYIPNSVKIIDSFAFGYCQNLKTVYISNNVEYIKDYAFTNCTNLEKITLPKHISSIPSNAFYGCFILNTFIWNGQTFKTFDDFKNEFLRHPCFLDEGWNSIETQDTEEDIEQELNDNIFYLGKNICEILFNNYNSKKNYKEKFIIKLNDKLIQNGFNKFFLYYDGELEEFSEKSSGWVSACSKEIQISQKGLKIIWFKDNDFKLLVRFGSWDPFHGADIEYDELPEEIKIQISKKFKTFLQEKLEKGE